jgi:drug/metabolite transporter (DMT)-like permease
LGIFLALFSAAMDTCTYFIIREIGTTIPKAIIPFISGSITTMYMFVYISCTDPLDFGFYFKHDPSTEDLKYRKAILLSFIGALCAWVAFEFMIIGLRISKSALASYGEMTGICVPFLFDIFYFVRKFLAIDALGLVLIVVLQVYNAIKKWR